MQVSASLPVKVFPIDRKAQMKDKDFYPSMQKPVKERKTDSDFETVLGTKKANFV